MLKCHHELKSCSFPWQVNQVQNRNRKAGSVKLDLRALYALLNLSLDANLVQRPKGMTLCDVDAGVERFRHQFQLGHNAREDVLQKGGKNILVQRFEEI